MQSTRKGIFMENVIVVEPGEGGMWKCRTEGESTKIYKQHPSVPVETDAKFSGIEYAKRIGRAPANYAVGKIPRGYVLVFISYKPSASSNR